MLVDIEDASGKALFRYQPPMAFDLIAITLPESGADHGRQYRTALVEPLLRAYLDHRHQLALITPHLA